MQKLTTVLLGLIVITQIPQAIQSAHFNKCVDSSEFTIVAAVQRCNGGGR